MAQWRSLQELLLDYQVTIKIVHVVFGLYVWEWLTSLYFELDFISGKKKFRWPLIFYLLNRYCLLVLLITLLVLFDTPSESFDNCPTVYKLSHFFGQTSFVAASANLTIRTIALWSNIYVTIGLCLATAGHVAIVFLDVVLSRGFLMPGFGCGPANPDTTNFYLRTTFIYALCLDFIVLFLNIYKLRVGMGPIGSFKPQSSNNLLKSGNTLAQMIFHHGLIYFLVALLTDVISLVFLFLNLNLAMTTITIAPAQVLSTVVACRAVRALTNFRYEESSGIQVLSGTTLRPGTKKRASKALQQLASGIHVQTETVTIMDMSEKV
ncbi:hypothetical protein CPB83DRAFT_805930 [Crepidotus variabilis]|uniref:Uncharacterized protein n=1 Tax=Crepidotus variabilis TaxID=179855 RepID=A0A9P6EPP0_9AGAR|nr:hypothetical protein CPB83DRAFT_805930 [Crepidotus variabilis]